MLTVGLVMLKGGAEGDSNESIRESYPTVIAPVKGIGTRLYPLTLNRSKSLLHVANVPIIERTFENIASYGCRIFWIVGEYDLYNYFRNGDVLSGRLGLSAPVGFNYTTTEDRGNADGVRIAL